MGAWAGKDANGVNEGMGGGGGGVWAGGNNS